MIQPKVNHAKAFLNFEYFLGVFNLRVLVAWRFHPNFVRLDDSSASAHLTLACLTAMRGFPILESMTREQLARRIAEVSLLRGEFTLRSGRKSKYYLDKYRFETQPDVLVELGKMFAARVASGVDRIAGAELGAVPLAAATAIASGKPFVIIRNQKKDYGTSKLVEGVLNEGETVMIVEDVLTTGGQVIEAAKTLRDAGAKVERIVAVIDREEGARENIERAGYVFEALFTTTDLGVVKE